MPLLQAHELTFEYSAGVPVVNQLSLTLEPGEMLGIIGPNGAGKSTVLKLLHHALTPHTGQIMLHNKVLSLYSRKECARAVAVVPQFLDIYFPFTVEEFVSMGRFAHQHQWGGNSHKDHEAITAALEETDTIPYRSRVLATLSGGERQRVMLAQALAQEPELLLLDEPIAHLDIGHQVQMLDLIRSLCQSRDYGVIITLHDLNLAGEYCDRLILMNNGSIDTVGSPQDVLTYKALERVYKTVVIVKENPVSHKPHIVLVSGNTTKGRTVVS